MIINKCKLVGSAFLAFGLLGNMAHGSSDADPFSAADPVIDVQDEDGNTSLHRLVAAGLRDGFNNTRGIEACIEYGVDPSLKNNEGRTALDILVRWIKNNEERDFELTIQATKVAQMLRIAEKARESALRKAQEALALAQSAQRDLRERTEALERAEGEREEALKRAEGEREEALALAESALEKMEKDLALAAKTKRT
ncbi:MAG: hypothetical protein LBH08_02950 [Puniceicoccales bacterium]|nr:hypothetical protein [Puniceicoccales bacterium]